MKCWLTLWVLLAVLLPAKSPAFLNASDPANIFSILAQAPGVLRVQTLGFQAPTPKSRYFLQELKVEETLFGSLSEAKIKTFQEVLVPQESNAFPAKSPALVGIAELPRYTAYAAARDQGAAYRPFGGKAGVIPLDEAGNELLAWSRKLFELKKSAGALSPASWKTLLLQAFEMKSARWVQEAALALGAMEMSPGFLSQTEVAKLLSLLQDVRLKPEAQLALIQALKKSAPGPSLEALQNLADGPSSSVKWAAVRALEDLGHKRPMASLKADFQVSDEAGKLKATAAVIRQRDAETGAFLREVLNGSEPVSVKREAIASMARAGGEEYEALLIGQMENPDPEVASQAMLALGRMQSQAAVPKLLEWIHSPSPTLRSAAIMSLRQSNDPRALEVLREKFPEEGMGHAH